MTNMIKNLSFGGMIAVVAMMMLTVSWTASENTVAPQWYAVSLFDETEDPNSPTNQKIDGPYGGTPSGSCNTSPGIMCAIQLDLDPNDPVPSSVHEADQQGLDISVTRQRQN